MKLSKSIIALLVVAIIGTAIAAGVGIYMNRPETVMQTSVQGLLTEVFEREEFEVVTNLMKSGSAEIILGLSDGENDVALEYKEYFGLESRETYIEKLKFSVNDFAVDGSFYAGEDYMYVSLPDIYSDAVGIVRGNSEKKFDSSIFAYDSETDYELDEETADAIRILCRIYDDAQDKNAVKDIENVLKNYVKLVLDSISEHADIEKENDSVKINGEEVNARVVTVKIDAECICNVLEDVYNELKKDKDIPKLIKKYGKIAEKYVEDTILEGELQSHFGDDEDDDFVDILLEEYNDMIDELGDFVEEAKDELDSADNFRIVIELATKKASPELMAVNATVKTTGEKMEIFDLQIGKDGIKSTDRITLEIAEEFTAEFKVEQNDRKGYECVIEITENGFEDEALKLYARIDKEDAKFEFGATFDGENYAVKGNYTAKGKTHTLEFKDIVYTDYNGEKYSMVDELLGSTGDFQIDFELKLIICENDKPKPLGKGKVKSVFDITEDDIADIETALDELVSEVENAFGNGVELPEIYEVIPDTEYGW
ncbi:MAG: hypothetical protein J6S71_02565 [Clostridia bacterium]|nr:hypothetical protein [Clostridia bacterium]